MLFYGACYYPEHWTAEQAEKHIALMQKAGINVVRMGEFAWCKFEPEQGRYRFDWLDEVIAALHKAHISTVLCTPTCIPPQWALQRYPDILQVDADGRVRNPGSRCHCCKNALSYQILSEGIVREMARHYGKMEGVIGWQTDNEFGCHHTTRCYCERCGKAFRNWLINKYGAEEAVNEAWGTAFWGFDFRQWTQIPLPRTMPAGSNPSHWLDFARFSSDSQINFHKAQCDIIRSLCPNHFITHNYMGRFHEIDYHKLSEHVDFASWDNYPNAWDDPYSPAYAHEITRSFKGRFWVMEEKSGPTGDAGSGLLGEQPEPGEIRRWAWQAVANGADGVLFFRWRACLSGAEQYWHGILDHDGVPRRRYAEIRRTGKEFATAAPELKNTRIDAKVALIRNFDILWAMDRQPGAPGFSYDAHCFELYRAVKRNGHSCDVVDVTADFTKYRQVIAPCLAIVDEPLVAQLEAFVKTGGTLVLTPQSGTRTPANRMTDATRPGLLADLAGVTVEEVRPYHHGQTNEIHFARGNLITQTCTVGNWVEVLECATAVPVAEYRDEALASKAAITANSYGQGTVYYMGVHLPPEVLKAFLTDILDEFPIKDIPEGVEVTQRVGPGKNLVFVINNTRERQTLTLPGQFQDVISGKSVGPEVAISKDGVLILKTV